MNGCLQERQMVPSGRMDMDADNLQRQFSRLQSDLQKARDRISALQVIHEVAASLTSELNLAPLLKKILAQAVAVMEASAGSLLLWDEATDELEFAVVEGGGGENLVGMRMGRDKGIAGWVATHREPLIVDDVSADWRYYPDIGEAVNFKPTSLLCVPMISHNRLIGVLQVMHHLPGRYFEEADRQLLTTFAHHAAIAIENARLYQSLKEERDHIVAVEEEVRKRLARDLHDGPTQLLASVVMSLSFIRQSLDRAPELAASELEQSLATAELALKQLRGLLFDLRPVILETQGLVPALEIYAERLRETEGLNITLDFGDNLGRLSPRAEKAVFSIVQEAVTNARKHADPHCVTVTLRLNRDADTFTVQVMDDGVGFDVEQVRNQYGKQGNLGLVNMDERAEMVNGTLQLRSEQGVGTTVTLTIPYRENSLEAEQDT